MPGVGLSIESRNVGSLDLKAFESLWGQLCGCTCTSMYIVSLDPNRCRLGMIYIILTGGLATAVPVGPDNVFSVFTVFFGFLVSFLFSVAGFVHSESSAFPYLGNRHSPWRELFIGIEW